MPQKGRPRLTPDELQERIARYCRSYRVSPTPEGLPPFPTGQRETRQHREWIAVYKAQRRLARRERGQCERCAAPASAGSVFCDEHRTGHPGGRRARTTRATQDLSVAGVRDGRCPICWRKRPVEAVARAESSGAPHVGLDARCRKLVEIARAIGPEGVDRLRAHLWPPGGDSPIEARTSPRPERSRVARKSR